MYITSQNRYHCDTSKTLSADSPVKASSSLANKTLLLGELLLIFQEVPGQEQSGVSRETPPGARSAFTLNCCTSLQAGGGAGHLCWEGSTGNIARGLRRKKKMKVTEVRMANISKLSPEILLLVFRHLTSSELKSAMQVCR